MITTASQNHAAKDAVRDCTKVLSNEITGSAQILDECAATDGTPLRQIVGEDPVEFAETFAQAYSGRQWIDKERARLTKAILDAEREEQK